MRHRAHRSLKRKAARARLWVVSQVTSLESASASSRFSETHVAVASTAEQHHCLC
jgi:hypothetical protein